MSRVGRLPIPLPDGVQASVEDHTVRVKGPNGELVHTVPPAIRVRLEDNTLFVERATDAKEHRALHGLSRALLANMVQGVHQGFTKALELSGVGYRATKAGDKLVLSVGFSHPVEVKPPAGLALDVPNPTSVLVKGADKQAVGELAAQIRRVRPPEPYKGKGIRYAGERIRRKVGKAGKK